MNPLIKDQIAVLRASSDPRDKSQATIIEMLCAQDDTLAAIKEQTMKTNGRVTKHDGELASISTRLETLEKPAGELRTLWNSGKSFAAVVVAAAGLVAGLVGSFSGGKETDQDAIKAAVAAAIEAKKETPPVPATKTN